MCRGFVAQNVFIVYYDIMDERLQIRRRNGRVGKKVDFRSVAF